MICEKCGKNEATYYYSETVNGKKSSIALCSECAPNDVPFTSSILSGLFADHPFTSGTKITNTAKKCETCGITFYEIRKSGKVGCSECYKNFKDELAPIIRRIHGTAAYKGISKTDVASGDSSAGSVTENIANETEEKITELREKLKTAVSEENYELAATLRDELRELTKKEGE